MSLTPQMPEPTGGPDGTQRMSRVERKRKDALKPDGSKKRKKTWLWVLLGVLAVLLAVAGYALATVWSAQNKMQPASVIERVQIKRALAPEKPADPFTYILLLGQDRRPGEGQTRTDTILLARLDSRDHSVVLVSIPRDTYTEIKGHGMTKINAASAYGGIPLTIETVSAFTGLPVNHYLEIDFEGFETVVDKLGGIDMYVSRPVNYGEGNTVEAGQQHLDGAHALAVMRNRHAYGDGDFARMSNQQLFLKAVARKIAQPESLTKVPGVLDAVAAHMKTDMPVSMLVSLARDYKLDGKDKMHTYTVPGDPKMIGKVSYVVTEEARAKALFDAIRAGKIPDASLGYQLGKD